MVAPSASASNSVDSASRPLRKSDELELDNSSSDASDMPRTAKRADRSGLRAQPRRIELTHEPPIRPVASAASRSSRCSNDVLNQCAWPSLARRRYDQVFCRLARVARTSTMPAALSPKRCVVTHLAEEWTRCRALAATRSERPATKRCVRGSSARLTCDVQIRRRAVQADQRRP